jgi:RNA polymerase sigma-70 factor (ECF subfamily)
MGKRRNSEGENRRLFDEYHPRVVGFFKSRGFSEDEALDLAQDTFVRVFENLHKLRSRASLWSWVLRIAANVWKNEIRYRRAGVRNAAEVSLDGNEADREAIEESILADKDVPSQLDEALADEKLEAVKRCLEELGPKARRCLALFVGQERKYQEIADLMKLSLQTVKSHISQARRRLEECVARRLAGVAP